MEIKELFPIPVGKFKFEKELDSTIIDFISTLPVRGNHSNQTSEYFYVLNYPHFKELKNFFLKSLHEFYNEIYCPDEPIELYITQSWINYTTNGGSHHRHLHQNSLISGVFYIETSTDDYIQFHKAIIPQFYTWPTHWNKFNCEIENYEAEKNCLLLFPSMLQHEVPRLNRDGNRISLSFNSFIKGNLGNKGNLNHLELK